MKIKLDNKIIENEELMEKLKSENLELKNYKEKKKLINKTENEEFKIKINSQLNEIEEWIKKYEKLDNEFIEFKSIFILFFVLKIIYFRNSF